MNHSDEQWMHQALALAQAAEIAGEVPVGALVIVEDQLIGQGSNGNINAHDPSAHAEIVALRDAGQKLGNHRLTNATLYVTLEPCMMCVGAMIAARIKRLVFGASDPKAGFLGGAFDARQLDFPNHRFEVTGGVCEQECGAQLREFFRGRRIAATPHPHPSR